MRTLLSLVLLLAACRKPVEEPSAAAPEPQAPSAAEEAPPEELAHVEPIARRPAHPEARLTASAIAILQAASNTSSAASITKSVTGYGRNIKE